MIEFLQDLINAYATLQPVLMIQMMVSIIVLLPVAIIMLLYYRTTRVQDYLILALISGTLVLGRVIPGNQALSWKYPVLLLIANLCADFVYFWYFLHLLHIKWTSPPRPLWYSVLGFFGGLFIGDTIIPFNLEWYFSGFTTIWVFIFEVAGAVLGGFGVWVYFSTSVVYPCFKTRLTQSFWLINFGLLFLGHFMHFFPLVGAMLSAKVIFIVYEITVLAFLLNILTLFTLVIVLVITPETLLLTEVQVLRACKLYRLTKSDGPPPSESPALGTNRIRDYLHAIKPFLESGCAENL